MIVCLCHTVNEESVRECVRKGAKSVCAVQKQCEAGTDCGSCVNHLQKVVQEELQQKEPNSKD